MTTLFAGPHPPTLSNCQNKFGALADEEDYHRRPFAGAMGHAEPPPQAPDAHRSARAPGTKMRLCDYRTACLGPLGKDYTSECSGCDGSECGGECRDAANILDLADFPELEDAYTPEEQGNSQRAGRQDPEERNRQRTGRQNPEEQKKRMARDGAGVNTLNTNEFDELIQEAEEYNKRFDAQQKRAGTSSGIDSGDSPARRSAPSRCSSSAAYSESPVRRSPDMSRGEAMPAAPVRAAAVRNDDYQGGIIRSYSHEPNTTAPPVATFPDDEIRLMYSEESDEPIMNVQWTDVDIDVVLDSGCSDHVMNVELDAPGYAVRPSDGSRTGRGFIVGNGERVPNEGESSVNLRMSDAQGRPIDFRSVFQSAKVTRPLMSVAKVCRNGYSCMFTEQDAQVKDKNGTTICSFRREKGIYVGRMELRAPTPFGGPA